MKAEYINPFIESTREAFTNMLGVEVRRSKVGVATKGGKVREVVGLIGISGGGLRGMVSLALPESTAISVTNALLMTEIDEVEETLKDAAAEFTNIVAGGAKAKLAEQTATPLDLSLPSIVTGEGFSVEFPTAKKWIEIHFEGDLGSFYLRVTMEETGGEAKPSPENAS